MSRELAEVRRYWPRAVTMVSGEWYTAAGLKADLYHIGQVWQVTITTPGSAYRRHCQPTIPEAMRAAGFGVRRPGIMAIYRKGWHELRRDTQIAIGFSPRVSSENHTRLQSTQRPRKGARLGRRKREVQP